MRTSIIVPCALPAGAGARLGARHTRAARLADRRDSRSCFSTRDAPCGVGRSSGPPCRPCRDAPPRPPHLHHTAGACCGWRQRRRRRRCSRCSIGVHAHHHHRRRNRRGGRGGSGCAGHRGHCTNRVHVRRCVVQRRVQCQQLLQHHNPPALPPPLTSLGGERHWLGLC
jgi:hypothetical protein